MQAVDLIRQEALGMLQLGRIAAAFLVDKDRLGSMQAKLSMMPSQAAKVLHLLENIDHLKLSHELVQLYIRLSVWAMHDLSEGKDATAASRRLVGGPRNKANRRDGRIFHTVTGGHSGLLAIIPLPMTGQVQHKNGVDTVIKRANNIRLRIMSTFFQDSVARRLCYIGQSLIECIEKGELTPEFHSLASSYNSAYLPDAFRVVPQQATALMALAHPLWSGKTCSCKPHAAA